MQQTARLDQPNYYWRDSAPHRPCHHFLVSLLQKLLLKNIVENLDASTPPKKHGVPARFLTTKEKDNSSLWGSHLNMEKMGFLAMDQDLFAIFGVDEHP